MQSMTHEQENLYSTKKPCLRQDKSLTTVRAPSEGGIKISGTFFGSVKSAFL